MAEIKVTDLPSILLEDFTDNDSFLIIDDGELRRFTKATFGEWLALNVKGEKGDQGVAGRDGARGANGRDGVDGKDGLSAYQVAVQNGFVGSVTQWEESLKGEDGADGGGGGDGWSPLLQIENSGNGSYLKIVDWFGGTGDKPVTLGYLGETGIVQNILLATNIKGAQGDRGLQGERGLTGAKGAQGDRGIEGERGLSPYDIAVLEGFEGTQEEWLISLNAATISQQIGNIITKNVDGLYVPSPDIENIATRIEEIPDKNFVTDSQKEYLENPPEETSLTIKQKYEANENTNAFTDEEKVKLEGLENETAESVKLKYESNPDTNAFTDDEKSKLNGLEEETAVTIKQKYESNEDTNAFTDLDKQNIADLLVSLEGVNDILTAINGGT